jgi:hypothetical protein
MNFTVLQAKVSKGVQRSDLATDIPDYINEAIREIEKRRSFTAMKAEATLTMSVGTSSATLPADFKELQNPREAVFIQGTDGSLLPVEVVSREQELQKFATLGSGYYARVYLDTLGTVKTIKIAGAADGVFTFVVRYYKFLPDLATGTDTNFFTNEYPRLIITKAKSLALSEVNDPIVGELEMLFEKMYREAVADDAKRDVSGLSLRMGG